METNISNLSGTDKLAFQDQLDKGFTPQQSLGAISVDSLTGTSKPLTIPTVQPSTLGAGITGEATAYLDAFAKQDAELAKRTAEAETAKKESKRSLVDSMNDILGITSSRGQLEEDAGIQQLADTADELRISLESSQRAQQNEIKALRDSGLTDTQLSQRTTEINRKYGIEQADLMFATDIAERRFDRAQRAIDRKIELKLEPLKLQMEFQKLFYQENRDDFTKAEERQFNTLMKNSERAYEEAKTNEQNIANILMTAAQNGVQIPQRVLNELNKAKSSLEAAQILQRNGVTLAKTGAEAPIVKTINGVDMQWNPSTGQWENIGSSVANDQKTIDQLSFLRQTAQAAAALSGASGASGISKTLGSFFVGDTKFKQLEALTNTLRTNVLTLMTDPGVKKYFGPQMSEADVRLMTAAGTTLNPENQSPTQLKTEVMRLDELLSRMQTAVQGGASGGAYSTLAPDGTEIIFTD